LRPIAASPSGASTNLQTGARDANELRFAPAGVPKPATNTQGEPRNRLTMSTSLGPAMHVPPNNPTEGVEMQEEPKTFAAFIGIDWADKKHDVCLVAAGVKKRERSILEHRPAAIRDWAEKLRERFRGAPIAVCLEEGGLCGGEAKQVVQAVLTHEGRVVRRAGARIVGDEPEQLAALVRGAQRLERQLEDAHLIGGRRMGVTLMMGLAAADVSVAVTVRSGEHSRHRMDS
jgi:hypothetical protein